MIFLLRPKHLQIVMIVTSLSIFNHARSAVAATPIHECFVAKLRSDHFFEFKAGKEIKSPPFEVPTEATTYFLGKGNFGSAYRVVPKKGAAFIMKVYMDAKNAQSDVVQLTEMRDRFGHLMSFKFSGAEHLGGKLVKLTDAIGRPLSELLKDQNISVALKVELREKFREKSESIVTEIGPEKIIISEIEMGDSLLLSVRFRDEEGRVKILNIDDFNVLVDPVTLEMTVYDPN